MKTWEAVAIAERDDVGQCSTCSDLAIDGEKFCERCKSYWEEDAPAMAEAEWNAECERMQYEEEQRALENAEMEDHFRRHPHG